MPGSPSTDPRLAAERAAAFVEAAHRYAELRWALIRAEGKRPKGEAWQDTKPEAPELVAGKWSRWGERYNLGVVCGPSGLAILDVDRDDDADRAALDLLGTDELPATPTVRTGRGSRLQLYFADPGGLEKHARDGFELRVGPHQCLAPPSVHPETGRAYAWLPGRAPWEVALAPLPETLIRYFAKERRNGSGPTVAPRRGETTAYGRAALEAEARAVAATPEGGRNDALNVASLKLGALVAGGELDETEARAALEVAAAACGLPTNEATATIDSGFTAGLATPRNAPPRQLPAAPLDVVATASEPTEQVSRRVWTIDAADLLAEPDPGPTPWLVDNLIVDRAIVACVGRWKTTKSYGLLDLCIAIATGTARVRAAHDPEPRPGAVHQRGVRPSGALAATGRALPRTRDRPRRAPRAPLRRRECARTAR